MEGFAEYNYATVTDENAKELEKLVSKVTEKVPKIKLDSKKNEKATQVEGDKETNVGTSDQAENPDSEKPQTENDLSVSFGKLFNSVKKKSEEISEIYKKDFSELFENVKQDASYAGTTLNSTWSKLSSNLQENYQKFQAQGTDKEVPETSESGEEKTGEASAKSATSGFFSSFNADKLFQRTELSRLTQGFNSFIKQVIEVEAPETSTKSEKRIATDRRETQILALQSNTSTFVDDPLEDDKYHEAYVNFSEKFDLETHQEQINHLLRSSNQLEKIHGRLVPNVIDNGIFWCRYFFHVRQLDLMEAKRKEAAEGALSSNEEIYSWGEDQQDEEEELNNNDSNISQTESKSSQRSESGADPSSHTDSYDMVSSGNDEPENASSSPKEQAPEEREGVEEGEGEREAEAEGEEAIAEEHKEGDDDWGVWE